MLHPQAKSSYALVVLGISRMESAEHNAHPDPAHDNAGLHNSQKKVNQMMNPGYHFGRMRELIEEFKPSEERAKAKACIKEAEMWLSKCLPTDEALTRDQVEVLGQPYDRLKAAQLGGSVELFSDVDLPTASGTELERTLTEHADPCVVTNLFRGSHG
jgi:hypothetical protein